MSAPVLDDCRQKFGEPPRSFSVSQQRYLTIEPPSWCWRGVDPLMRIYNNQSPILRQGRLVWGHLVQANQLLFQPGDADCPASVVYSFDPWFDDHLDDLADIAHLLFQLKDNGSRDPAAAQIGRYLAAETERQFGLPVPRNLTAGRDVLLGDIMVPRKHLPAGFLAQPYFPLVVDADPTRGALILPSHYWSEGLLADWNSAIVEEVEVVYPRSATYVSKGMSPATKILIGVLGGGLMVSLLCAGVVGGMVALIQDRQAGQRRVPAPAVLPAAAPWQPRHAPQVRPHDFRQMQEEQQQRWRDIQQRMEQDARRRSEEMQRRLEEDRQQHREMLERHRRAFDQ